MSWKKVRLGDFLEAREERYKPRDPKIIGLKRIEKIDFSGKIYLSDKPSNTDMIIVRKGDLVISGINVEKGAMNIYHGEEDVVATIHYSSYKYDNNKIDIEFLQHFLKSLKFKNALKEQVPGGIKTEIKPKHILSLSVDIPSGIVQQRQIVDHLNFLNHESKLLYSELSHQLYLVKQLRQAFLSEAMQGKLCHSDYADGQETGQQLLERIKAEKAQLIKDKKLKKEKELPLIEPEEIPFEIPKNWTWCRLGDILKEIKYGTSQSCDYDASKNSPVLRIPNVSTGVINIDDLKYANLSDKEKKDLFLQENDLLIVRSNGSREIVGKTVLVKKGHIGYYFAGYLIRLRYNSNLINANFLWLLSMSAFFREMIETPLRTTVGINNINTSEISLLKIPLPPATIQNQIVQKLEQLIQTCNDLEASIKQSQQQNEQLLQQVLKEALEEKEEVGI